MNQSCFRFRPAKQKPNPSRGAPALRGAVVATSAEYEGRGEEQVEGTAMLLQGLLSVMRYAFYVFDVRLGAIAQGEKEMAALFGYSPEEIHALPQSWLSLVHPDDVPIHDQSQKQLMASKDGEVLTKKLRIKHKEGRWEWVTFTRQPHERDEQGHEGY